MVETKPNSTADVAKTYDRSRAKAYQPIENPPQKRLDEIAGDLQATDQRQSATRHALPDQRVHAPKTAEEDEVQPAKLVDSIDKHLPYITVGSTRDEVLAIQGTPTALSDGRFEYGASKIYFNGDKVVSWENAPAWIPLKVKLLPVSPVRERLSYFTVGSTTDEVLAVQGTPTAFSHNEFDYGASKVYFGGGKVVSWENAPAWIPLKVRLRPQNPVETSLGYFTVGSTKDEVLAVQGTPTAFSRNEFDYGASKVYFKNDKVVNWENAPAWIPLKVQLR